MTTKVDLSKAVPIPPPQAHSSIYQVLCERVSRSLVVAQRRTFEEKEAILDFIAGFRECWIQDYGAEEIALPTTNGTTIHGLHFKGCQKKAIVFLQGNGYFCENAAEKPLRWREGLKIGDTYPHLIVFNPGGIGKSEGNVHPDTTARDILAVCEYLFKEFGIDPSDIVFSGYSMGGFVGPFGAALVQQRFPECQINFLCERSFASIYSRIKDESSVVRAGKTFGAYMTRWDQDPIAALESLKGRVCIVYHKGDKVILYPDSTHNALRSKNYTCISLEECEGDAHNRELTEAENQRIVVEMKRMLCLPLTLEEELLT